MRSYWRSLQTDLEKQDKVFTSFCRLLISSIDRPSFSTLFDNVNEIYNQFVAKLVSKSTQKLRQNEDPRDVEANYM
jgi:hypothetical protein